MKRRLGIREVQREQGTVMREQELGISIEVAVIRETIVTLS